MPTKESNFPVRRGSDATSSAVVEWFLTSERLTLCLYGFHPSSTPLIVIRSPTITACPGFRVAWFNAHSGSIVMAQSQQRAITSFIAGEWIAARAPSDAGFDKGETGDTRSGCGLRYAGRRLCLWRTLLSAM